MGELRRIPGIGAAGERDLLELGYTTVQSLAGRTRPGVCPEGRAGGPLRAVCLPLRGLLRVHPAAGPGEAEVVGVERWREENSGHPCE